MTYYVRAPGTCGEFLQGSIDGQSFLVTCPINRYSYALSNVIQPFSKEFCALQPKSAQARKLVQELVQEKKEKSNLPACVCKIRYSTRKRHGFKFGRYFCNSYGYSFGHGL